MDTWQLVIISCCIIPTAIIMLVVYFAVRSGLRAMRALTPGEKHLIEQYVALRDENPDASTRKLVSRIIHQQSMRAGLIGGITGAGGVFTLPIGLPADLVTTARIQGTTLHLIAWAYELENPGSVPKVLSVDEILGMKQGGKLDVRVDQATHQIVIAQSEAFAKMASRRALLIVGEKAFAKFIPGLGFLIGFAVNYLTMRSAAQLAVEWYSGNIQSVGEQIKAARENLSSAALQLSPALRDAGQRLADQTGHLRTALAQVRQPRSS